MADGVDGDGGLCWWYQVMVVLVIDDGVVGSLLEISDGGTKLASA